MSDEQFERVRRLIEDGERLRIEFFRSMAGPLPAYFDKAVEQVDSLSTRIGKVVLTTLGLSITAVVLPFLGEAGDRVETLLIQTEVPRFLAIVVFTTGGVALLWYLVPITWRLVRWYARAEKVAILAHEDGEPVSAADRLESSLNSIFAFRLLGASAIVIAGWALWFASGYVFVGLLVRAWPVFGGNLQTLAEYPLLVIGSGAIVGALLMVFPTGFVMLSIWKIRSHWEFGDLWSKF